MSNIAKPVYLQQQTPPHISTLILCAGLGSLGMNFFLPSLPGLAEYFETDYAVIQLAVSLYLASTAVLQLFLGPLSDRYGRRPIMLAGFAIFLAGTLVSLMATSVEAFLAGRVIQGTAIGGVVLGRAIIRDTVDGNRAASMIGYVTMGMTIVPMIGPVIGGFLEESFGWQASFWVMFGFGLFVFAITWFDLGETNHQPSTSFGAQFRAYPELLKSRRFWGYTLTAAFSSGAFFAFLGGAPYVAENWFHLSPSEYGLFFGVLAFGYMVGNFLSGRYSVDFGITRMMTIGALVVATGVLVSILLFHLGLDSPLAYFGPLLGVGMGNGMTLPSANAGMISVRPRLAGSASGLGGSLQIGGGALLSVAAGASLGPGTGPTPLLYVMLATALAAVASIVMVIMVDRSMNQKEQD